MRTRSRVALVAAVTACLSGGLSAQERTEQELIDLIVRDGPRARAIRAASDVVAYEQAARLDLPNPVATYAREGAGFTEFMQVEQVFPAFGLRRALERVGVAAREAAEAERDARLWQLRGEARHAVARLRTAAAHQQSGEAVVRLIEELIGVLRIREQEGEGARFDRLRAEQELADVQEQLVSAAIERSDARRDLSALLPTGTTVPELRPVALAAPAPASLDALLVRATSSRPELRALQAVAQRFSLEAEAARRATNPAPVVSGGLKRAGDGAETRTGPVIGVGVSLPLFNRGSRAAARWNAERTRTEFERAVIEAEIRAQITGAFEAVTLRRQSSAALETSLASGEELIAIADVAYREGDIGILQLLDAYRTVARARARAIEAQLNLSLAQIALERAVGVTLWP